MNIRNVATTLVLLVLAACGGSVPTAPDPAPPPTIDFRDPSIAWTAGFADAALYMTDQIGFVAERRPLPAPLQGRALYQYGYNTSDDLCMWFAFSRPGFDPAKEYAVAFDVGIASDAGLACEAGTAVATYVKAGASSYLPGRVEVNGYWQMNVDKGVPPAGDGRQALALGDIRNDIPGCPSTNRPWGERSLSSGSREIRVRPSNDGTIWFFVMTDSGFESPYQLYFTFLNLRIRAVPPTG